MNEENVEHWRKIRFVAWWSWVAQRGSKDIPSPQDLKELPGDEKVVGEEVKREDYDDIFKTLSTTWKPPLSPE